MKSEKVVVSASRNELKQAVKESLGEFFTEKKEILHNAFLEVIEDIGMSNAIKEGEKSAFVSEKEVFKALKKA